MKRFLLNKKTCRCEESQGHDEAIQPIGVHSKDCFVTKAPRKDKTGAKKGFTLAEVLITLGIIGVVAAITIPTLIQKTDKTQYLTKLKKAYAQGNEVLKLMTNDMGCPNDLKCTGLFEGTGDYEQDNIRLGQEIAKYFKLAKNCGTTDSGGCMSNNVAFDYDGGSRNGDLDTGDGDYRFITADGISFMIANVGSNCGDDGKSSGATGHLAQYCGDVIIDLDGPDKGSNSCGKDIFFFYITNGKGALLYPRGGIDDTQYWRNDETCSSSSDPWGEDPWGWSCAGRIMDEGWQINYYGGSSSSTPAIPDCSPCSWDEGSHSCMCD